MLKLFYVHIDVLLRSKSMYLLWNQYQGGPTKTVGAIASETMLAIALAAIGVGNNNGNSGSGGSSGGSVGGGGCSDKDICGYRDGGGHTQQSTKDGSGRNGGGDSDGIGYNNNDGKSNDGGHGNSSDGGTPSQQTIIS
jgi:hypothetical protein